MGEECRRCRERGQTWSGDKPRCAFKKVYFDQDNWNCATMNALRDAVANENVFWSEDQHLGIIIRDGQFLVMGWYKNRGQTQSATVIAGESTCFLSEKLAEEFLT